MKDGNRYVGYVDLFNTDHIDERIKNSLQGTSSSFGNLYTRTAVLPKIKSEKSVENGVSASEQEVDVDASDLKNEGNVSHRLQRKYSTNIDQILRDAELQIESRKGGRKTQFENEEEEEEKEEEETEEDSSNEKSSLSEQNDYDYEEKNSDEKVNGKEDDEKQEVAKPIYNPVNYLPYNHLSSYTSHSNPEYNYVSSKPDSYTAHPLLRRLSLEGVSDTWYQPPPPALNSYSYAQKIRNDSNGLSNHGQKSGGVKRYSDCPLAEQYFNTNYGLPTGREYPKDISHHKILPAIQFKKQR